MNQITIITLCYKRPSILRAFLENHSKLNPIPHIVIAGSPDDDCAEIVSEYQNCDYIVRPNLPAGKKANDATEHAKGSAKYYMFTGSDDLMNQSMWDEYQKFAGDHLGLKDLYFFDTVSRQLIHWKGYSETSYKFNMPIGAGKLVSARLLEATNWRPYQDGSQWPREYETHQSFLKTGADLTVRTMDEMNGVCVDLKSCDSITKFQLFPNSEFVDVSELIKRDTREEIWPLIESIK